MLLISPTAQYIRWCYQSNHGRLFSEFAPGRPLPADFLAYLDRADTVAYRLPHGGPYVQETAKLVDSDVLATIHRCADFLPLLNLPLVSMADKCIARRPDAVHVVLCDTAIFSELPLPSRTYGLPYELLQEGVRRYGADGICFQWMYDAITASPEHQLRHWIGVHLDEESSLSAFVNNHPIDTSAGFSFVGGVPGLHSCGDIDPAIPMLLMDAGDAGHLLASDSGLQTLVSHPIEFSDILAGTDPEVAAARDVLEHNLALYLGGMFAALGKVETVVFTSSILEAALPLVYALCKRLAFAGVQYQPALPGQHERVIDLTGCESEVQILAVNFDPWRAMSVLAEPLLKKDFRA